MTRGNARARVGAALAAGAFVVAGALADTVHAQEPTRAERLIQYRRALYRVIGGNFGPLAAMVQGKAPYEAGEFIVRAERVAYLAKMLDEVFPEDSRSGAPTKAREEIWSNRVEFDRLLKDMQEKTAALAHVAKARDMEQIRPALGAAGNACKACHDKFREK
jgi:cytochrome c556